MCKGSCKGCPGSRTVPMSLRDFQEICFHLNAIAELVNKTICMLGEPESEHCGKLRACEDGDEK